MLLGEYRRRRDICDRGLELVVPAAHNVAFTVHHRLVACGGNVGGIVLFALADLRVQHVGALEKIGFGGARHQARHRDATF